MYLLEVAAFVLLFGLPLFPGLREILRPRDQGSLVVKPDRERNPCFLGDSMRAKIASVLERSGPGTAHIVPFLERHGERARIDSVLTVTSRGADADAFVATDRVEIEPDAFALDVYGKSSVNAGNGARVRTLLSDGDVRLGNGCKIGRWIDAGGALSVGNSCDLGYSASAGGRVLLGAETRFRRVWGTPVAAGEARDDDSERDGEPVRALEPRDVVSRKDLRIDAGRAIGGTVKSHGALTIGTGARIAGNVISRGDVAIERGARIDGHVFSEGWLTIGPGVRIGKPESRRTAYAAKGIHFAPGARVFGWLVSDGAESCVR